MSEHDHGTDQRIMRPLAPHRPARNSALIAVLASTLAIGGIAAFAKGDTDKTIASADTTPASVAIVDPAAVVDPAAAVTDAPGADLTAATVKAPDAGAVTTAAPAGAGVTPVVAVDANVDIDDSALVANASDGTCLLTVQSVRAGASGESVACLQRALATNGYYTGQATGTFDVATDTAVRDMQTDRDLFVDGVVGRESAISLGIWPDEASLVVHTPPPPAGAQDSLGFPLSSVSSTGADAPPLPENSGSGRRLVYDRAGQRVWAVSKDGEIIRSWLVSGSKYSNETPGTHEVYSKSEQSTAWNGKAILPHMVRWLKTDIGAIGFHGIPIHVSDGTVYQTEAELGTRLSGGCQRQANRDADFVWAFADIGTPVVVV
jgi:hypothetical protein